MKHQQYISEIYETFTHIVIQTLFVVRLLDDHGIKVDRAEITFVLKYILSVYSSTHPLDVCLLLEVPLFVLCEKTKMQKYSERNIKR